MRSAPALRVVLPSLGPRLGLLVLDQTTRANYSVADTLSGRTRPALPTAAAAGTARLPRAPPAFLRSARNNLSPAERATRSHGGRREPGGHEQPGDGRRALHHGRGLDDGRDLPAPLRPLPRAQGLQRTRPRARKGEGAHPWSRPGGATRAPHPRSSANETTAATPARRTNSCSSASCRSCS